ncbi:ABC transporter permease [Lichenicola sp.]|uniref:ABC transporter permease n=1 Tax=Lichenicola sp. TaxID=2804529 RepID=UPI003B005A01
MSPAYLLRQLLGAIPLLLAISLILFAIVHLAPGGPLDMYTDNPSVTPAALEHIRRAYGLDRPVPLQYLMWLRSMVVGDWGFSIRTGRPVLAEIADRLPATLLLGGTAMLLAFLLALPVGVLTALHRSSRLDHLLTLLSFSGISIPVFWLALMLQLLFSIMLGWLPAAGYTVFGDASLGDRLAHLAMPACVLSLATAAGWSRFLRSSLLDVLRQDYIRTAYAKGQTTAGMLVHHALRNALVPMVTVMALDLASIISGAVITETVFAWPGIGRLFIESMDGRDYPVLMGLMMTGSLALVLANLAADIAYAVIDPRIRFG